MTHGPIACVRHRSRTVDLVYINAGGGHLASAVALEAAIKRDGLPWTVRLVNLIDVLDPNQSFRKVTGMNPEDVYNKRLARGWTLGLAQELKLLQGMIRCGHAFLMGRLQRHWLTTEPDMVVSLVPNFNRAMCESLASTLPGVPYVTVLTDLADHPPHFWIEPGLHQHLVCGSAKAVQQALAAGYRKTAVHATTGMIVRSDFYDIAPIDRAAERRRRGLDPDRPTALVLFGGQGSNAMLTIARHLPETQLILVCGHNARLAQRLRALPARAPRLVLGFTSDIARHMQLADFFIGKPGPGSVSEAIQLHLPVIVERNRWTLPQERFNAQWIVERGVGIVLSSFGKIGQAVNELTTDLDRYKASTRDVANRASFEVPAILHGILTDAEVPTQGLDVTRQRASSLAGDL